MKKYIPVICLLTTAFISCQKEKTRKTFQSGSIPTLTVHVSGEVIYKGGDDCHFYDIAITDDYYAFLNHYSDTLVQVFRQKDMSPYKIGLREEKEPLFAFPSFIKKNYKSKAKNHIEVWDNNSFSIKEMGLDDNKNNPVISYSVIPFSKEVIPCSNIHLTEKEFCATPYLSIKDMVFYSYNRETGYYYVPPYPVIPNINPAHSDINPYVGCISVSEEKNRIVAALRYINTVNFYDLNCDIFNASAFGDTYVFPEYDAISNFFNLERSRKCFIDICSTDKYIYCLYDGTVDFSASSIIVIFDWDGNHIRNLQTNKNIRQIAVDASDTYIMAIISNETGTRDILKLEL